MYTQKDQKYKHLFDTSLIAEEIKRKSVKAGFANILSQGVSLGITLVRAAVLARLLSPEDYGVFAMVVVVASFALIFKDLGLGTATVREKEITHSQVSNLFWINTLLGVVSMLLVVIIAPAIVWFYEDPRLSLIAIVLSVAFLFAGMSVQHQALLKRQMQFGKIAVITVSASLSSSLAGIGVAWLYGNYWALVWMQILQSLFMLTGFWIATGWIPSFYSKRVSTGKFIKVGLDVAGLNGFSTITKQIDKIIIGRIASAGALGLYSKGGQVPKLISEQFRMAFFQIALPALSSLQGEKKRFASYYYKFLNVVCWSTMPFAAFLFVFAEEIVHVYFGSQWAGSVIFMRIFAINAFIMPAITTLDQIPLALGFSRQYLFAGMVRSFALLGCVALVTPFYGVIGIACCVAVSDLIAFVPFVKLCLKDSPVSIKKYCFTVAVPLFVSVCMTALFYLFKFHPAIQGLIPKLVYMSCFFILTAVLFILSDVLNMGTKIGVVPTMMNRLKVKRKL